MSKIEQLIKEKCPNGVEYKKLKELVDYIQPTKYIVKDTRYDDKYDIPVLTAGQTFILGYTNEEIGIYKADKNNPVIIFDDFTTSNHWIDFQFKVKSSAMKILISKTQDNFKYIYYCIKNIKYIPKEHSRQWIQTFSEFKIPLPPIEVQEEIVKILDKFSELERTLKTELEERKKQYEFWRNILFKNIHNIKMLKISEFAKCIVGATPSTKKIEYWQNGTINWMSSGEVNYGQITSVKKKITTLGYQNSSTKMLPINTVVVALAGQGKTRGTVAITRIPLCTNQSLCGIIPDGNVINNDYLYYYLQSRYKDLRNISAGDGTRGGLNLKMISTYKIPVPPLQEQERIVKILDKFDKLINDISEGIPAEIETRRKQYEYYRNKLLSFEELKTND